MSSSAATVRARKRTQEEEDRIARAILRGITKDIDAGHRAFWAKRGRHVQKKKRYEQSP